MVAFRMSPVLARKRTLVVAYLAITLVVLTTAFIKRQQFWNGVTGLGGGKIKTGADHFRPPFSSTSKNENNNAPSSLSSSCPPSVGGNASSVVLVVKTGASEAFHRIPILLTSFISCVPKENVLIFSDMNATIGNYELQDSLDEVPDWVRAAKPEFELYEAQKSCVEYLEHCVDAVADSGHQGWALDKYKNIFVAERSWRQRPGFDWYVFIDADTYVVWENVVAFLGKFNATEKLFFGSTILTPDFDFAHGGSGYALSRAAMEDIASRKGLADSWMAATAEHCCGDSMFSEAMKKSLGLAVQNARPIFNGEHVYTFPFGPFRETAEEKERHWCDPVGAMHHITPFEASEFWEFEISRSRKNNGPMTFAEVFHRFVASKLQRSRDDWSNTARQIYLFDWSVADTNKYNADTRKWGRQQVDKTTKLQKNAHLSRDDCQRACEEDASLKCLSWMFREDGLCAVDEAFRLGAPQMKKKDDDKRVFSGWHIEAIEKWIKSQGECTGDKVAWPLLG